MPLTSDGTLSSPADGASDAKLWLMVSLMRARLMMHSRMTDSATLRKSSACSGDVSSPSASGSTTCVRRNSCCSSRSSTRSRVDAISRMMPSPAMPPCSTTLFSRLISPSMSPRNSPRPRTPSVSLIFFSSSSCGTSSDALFMPVRTNILDARKVLANRRTHGFHEPGAGRGQRFASVFDLLVARYQLFEIERRPDAADTFAGCRRARDVIEKVVEQIVDGVFLEGQQAFIDDELELAVDLAEQPLQGDRCLEAAVLQ